MTFEELLFQFKTAKPLLLFRAKNIPFIISFLQKYFVDAAVTKIPNGEVRSKLEGYMEELNYEEKDEELEAGSLFDDFSIKASQYLINGTMPAFYGSTLLMKAKTCMN